MFGENAVVLNAILNSEPDLATRAARIITGCEATKDYSDFYKMFGEYYVTHPLDIIRDFSLDHVVDLYEHYIVKNAGINVGDLVKTECNQIGVVVGRSLVAGTSSVSCNVLFGDGNTARFNSTELELTGTRVTSILDILDMLKDCEEV